MDVLILGNGVAGNSAASTIRQLDKEASRILVVAEENNITIRLTDRVRLNFLLKPKRPINEVEANRRLTGFINMLHKALAIPQVAIEACFLNFS